jgi:hypothetical protein
VAQHRLVVDGFFGGGPDDRGLARSRRLRQRGSGLFRGLSIAAFRGSVAIGTGGGAGFFGSSIPTLPSLPSSGASGGGADIFRAGRFGSSVAVFRGSGAACGLAGVPTIFVPA